MEDLLTPHEVSLLLGISIASVYRYLKSGYLEGIETSTGVRVSRETLTKKIGGSLVGTGRANILK